MAKFGLFDFLVGLFRLSACLSLRRASSGGFPKSQRQRKKLTVKGRVIISASAAPYPDSELNQTAIFASVLNHFGNHFVGRE